MILRRSRFPYVSAYAALACLVLSPLPLAREARAQTVEAPMQTAAPAFARLGAGTAGLAPELSLAMGPGLSLGLPVGTVKSRLTRARQALRAELGDLRC